MSKQGLPEMNKVFMCLVEAVAVDIERFLKPAIHIHFPRHPPHHGTQVPWILQHVTFVSTYTYVADSNQYPL